MSTTTSITRNDAIKRIKAALKKRSGKDWSVTGGKGTAYGWIEIDAPPKRRTWQYASETATDNLGRPVYTEVDDPSREFGHMSPADRAELGELLGMPGPCHYQGHSIPAGSDFYREYIDRAEGREPSVRGQRYWD